jgi:hypothetical protein
VKRLRSGREFALTVKVYEYAGVREDFIHYFEGVETFCVGVERYSQGGSDKENIVSNRVHLHVYLKLYEKVYLSEVREVLESFCFGSINLQSCRSRRNWLKYIRKEDERPYFNCKISELSSVTSVCFGRKVQKDFQLPTRLLLSIVICGGSLKSFIGRLM